MKKFFAFLLLPLMLLLSGCDHAPSNVITAQTTNCGQSWSVIPPGKRIPSTTSVDGCSYNTVLPNFPMQGDAEFKAEFKGGTLVTFKVAYDYEITDAVKYLQEAKFLGRSGPSAEQIAKRTNMDGFETAENIVIDKRMRDLANTGTKKTDILSFNSSAFEDELENSMNAMLKERGLKLNSLSLVPVPEEQTRLAIDVGTAMKVYENAGLSEVGQKIMVARSGASRVVVETNQINKPEK